MDILVGDNNLGVKVVVVEFEDMQELRILDSSSLKDTQAKYAYLQLKNHAQDLEIDPVMLDRLGSRRLGFGMFHGEGPYSHFIANRFQRKLITGDEIQEVVNFTFDDASRGRMPFFTKEEFVEAKKVVFEHALKGTHLYFQDSNGPLAFVVTVPFHLPGRSVSLVSWKWVRDKSPKEVRETIRSQFAEFYCESREKEVLAIIDRENSRSQSFARKIGFRPRCVCIRL